jgi:hypothetical protein
VGNGGGNLARDRAYFSTWCGKAEVERSWVGEVIDSSHRYRGTEDLLALVGWG